jgi:sec-independent protein translocase protein TatC
MSFWEHLQELRVRLVRSILAIVAAFALTYAFRFRIWDWAQRPMNEAIRRVTKADLLSQPFAFTDPTEPFFSGMRLSFWAAAFVAAPFVFYQLWAFIRPGLHARERRFAVPFVLATSGCFLGGAWFAYRQAFTFLVDILYQEAVQLGLRANIHMNDYLDLFISTLLITGVMFELPVLFYFLSRFRIVTAKGMLRYWRHASVAILVASAFFTPGDVIVTTIFFSVVLLGLYFVSVLVSWIAEPRGR